MARWLSKRWVWAAMAGAAVTVGMAAARDGGPPKVGAVISLNIDGKGERQFKVLKSDKQGDGTYLSELKDTKTGETITLVDKPGDPAPGGANVPEPPKAPEPPKGPARPAAPAASDPMKEPAKEPEKRTILGRIFGNRDKPPAMPGPSAAMPAMPGGPPAAAPEPEKKQGLLGRVFGPKKPTGPSMPGPSTGDAGKSSASSPPAVIPTPPGGVAGGTKLPPFPTTGGSSTAEPPRVMPSKPGPSSVSPPVPFVPPPAPVPTAPSFPTPAPLPVPMPSSAPSVPTPMPSVPAPMPATPSSKPLPPFPAPSIPTPMPSVPTPAPATGGGLPPIPVPPGGTSAAQPIQVIVPVGFVPAGIAYDREVQPFVIALQTMNAPSARLTAAKGLAEGRHGSSDGVKAVLFQAARMDPCGEIRAACIDHLCKLGYFSPQFLGYIQAVCEDKDPMVSASAQAACAKMLRQPK